MKFLIIILFISSICFAENKCGKNELCYMYYFNGEKITNKCHLCIPKKEFYKEFPKLKPKKNLKLKCKKIKSKGLPYIGTNLYRCENDEVVCYERSNNISCMFKEAK